MVTPLELTSIGEGLSIPFVQLDDAFGSIPAMGLLSVSRVVSKAKGSITDARITEPKTKRKTNRTSGINKCAQLSHGLVI